MGWVATLSVWYSLPGSLWSDFILSIIKLMRLCSPNYALRCSLKDEYQRSLSLQISYWVSGACGGWVVFAVCYAPNPPESVTSFGRLTISMLTRWDQTALFAVWRILSPYVYCVCLEKLISTNVTTKFLQPNTQEYPNYHWTYRGSL